MYFPIGLFGVSIATPTLRKDRDGFRAAAAVSLAVNHRFEGVSAGGGVAARGCRSQLG
jgi:hypothetical protein